MNPILTYISQSIDCYFHEPYASLLKGVTYGIPLQLSSHFKMHILRSGLTHLVVLSGANITILVSAVEIIFSHFGKKVGMALNCIFIGIFTSIVGVQAPLLRALIMFIGSSICIYTGRPSYIWWNIWLSVFFIAVYKPMWITSLSFVLSLTATVGLVVAGWFIKKRARFLPTLVKECIESVIVCAFTLPISVLYFHSFSLISPLATTLASLLILPLMTGGLLLPVIHILFPPLALLISYPLSGLLYTLVTIIEWSSTIPFGFIQWGTY